MALRTLSCAILALSTAAAFAQQDLPIPNPGFETVDEGTLDREAGPLPARWQPRSLTGNAHRLSDDARSGSAAALIEFEDAPATGYYYSEPQPLPPCREVTVTAWAKVSIPEELREEVTGAYPRLMFRRGEDYVRLLTGAAIGDTGGEWRQITISGSPPPEADSWRMSVEFNGVGVACFDDCSATMLPLATIPAVSADTPAGEPMALGDGRYGVLGEPVEVTDDVVASTTAVGRSALPPALQLGVIWFDARGQQLGVHQTTERAWQQPTDIRMQLRPLAGATTARPIVFAASQEQWFAASVEIPTIERVADEQIAPSEVQMSGHPRLFVSPGHLQRLRELVAMDRERLAREHPHFAHYLEMILRDADRCFEEEEIVVYSGRYSTTLPPALPRRHEDNFPYWTGLSREIERRIEKLATAYLLTGQQRYAELCTEWTLALCEWPQWTDPDYANYNACLDTGHFCHAVAFAYDFLYDTLTADEREVIRNALLEKGAAAVMADATAGWAQRIGWPNGFAVVMGGMGIAGAATLGDDPRAEQYLQYARRRLHEFLSTRDQDGGYVEGHTYGGYAMSHVMPFAGTLAVHGDDALVAHPYLEKTLRFITYCLDPMTATSVNFCDSNYSARAYRSTAAWLARNGDPLAWWYLAHDEGFTRMYEYVPPIGLLWMPLEGSGEGPDGWPMGAHYRDIGWVIARSGFADTVTPGDPSILFAMRSGYHGSHCQLDSNSFMLNVNGRWLLRDPGYGRTATSEHSTLLVRGDGQAPRDAHMAAFGNVGEMVYAVGDASICYRDLSDFRRHAVMIAGEYVVIFDEIAFAGAPVSIASQLVTDIVEPDIAGDRRIVLRPDSDEAAAREQACTIVFGSGGPISVEDYQGKAKIVQHHEREGLFPTLLWPDSQGPEASRFHTADDRVGFASVEHGDTRDYLLLNLSGEQQSVAQPETPEITTDARLAWIRMRRDEIAHLSLVWGSRLEVDGEVIVELDRRQDYAR